MFHGMDIVIYLNRSSADGDQFSVTLCQEYPPIYSYGKMNLAFSHLNTIINQMTFIANTFNILKVKIITRTIVSHSVQRSH